LGFRPDSRIVLIIGGGDGMPKGKKILRQILKRNLDAEIAIVCGNDFRLYHTALKLIQKHKISNLKVYGYIDYVDLLISISDIVLTKCGASTFMEILIMGKVPVISNYIWEQEKGNADYICSNRMGILEKNTRQLPSILDRLLRDDQYYNSIRENILNASLINGTSAVSDYILNFHL
jgi:processive 1,2-diacylglycerol beta-glucosyltransferase/1,2-diacylglycerol 3-beta-galactosyltransferase